MTPATLAARDSAAVFLLEGRTHIEITGKDRAAFLHNFCTNDIKTLAPGQGCEAFFCNVKGRVLGHVTVFIGDESIWLESVPNAGPKLMTHLDRYIIREDVQLHDRTDKRQEVILTGPDAADSLTFGGDSSALRAVPAPGVFLNSGNIWMHCVDWLGSRSFLLMGEPATICAAYGLFVASERLAVAGLRVKVTAGTTADWEALRIDAGFPSYGVDITEDNLPQEVGRNAQCISFTKGCYLGQEPIARLDALGHTNRELRQLMSDGSTIPPHGAELLDPASQQPIGHITSAAANPFGDGVVALGYLKSNWLAPGTRVLVAGNEFRVR